MALIAHMSDVHLGYAQYRLSEREEDIYEVFEKAYDIAVRDRVDAVVISGDVFHSPRPPNRAILNFIKTVKTAGDRGIPTLVVAGEHDQIKKRGDISPLLLASQLSQEVKFISRQGSDSVIGKMTIERNGTRLVFYGIDAIPRISERVEKYTKLFRAIEREAIVEGGKKVLVAHLPIEGLMANLMEPTVPIASLPRGIDYFALGHLHIRYFDRLERGGALGYPGSMDILSRQEISEWRSRGKGFFIIDLSGDEPFLHKVDLDIRPQLIVEGEDSNALLKRIEELTSKSWTKQPILHIIAKLSKAEEQSFRIQLDKILRKNVLDFRLEVHRKDLIAGLPIKTDEEALNEPRIISHLYGIDLKAALAIVKLKDCLSSRSKPEECESEIEDVLAFKKELSKISGGQLRG